MNTILENVVNWATTAGLRLIIAIVLFFVSFKIVNAISRKIEKSGERGKMDKTLSRTFAYIFKLGMKVLIAICLILVPKPPSLQADAAYKLSDFFFLLYQAAVHPYRAALFF